MAKRQKEMAKGENYSAVNSSYRVVKQENDSKDSVDRISRLPDETLVSILSLLPLNEATATSILSRRWRYLWTLLLKLDFDGKESFLKVLNGPTELNDERCNYVGWVDDVISALQRRGSLSSIEEFRVFFYLTKVHKTRIDKWLRYVVANNKKKIRRLELDLTNYVPANSRNYDECYTFPDELLLSGNNNFELLKSLSLNYVNVSGSALEFLVHNSPHLEDLSVCHSGHLSALKIISPFPSFKRLEISRCFNLNSLEIRDAKIVYLKYKGFRIRHVVLENIPLLVELCIGGVITEHVHDVLVMFARYLPQLEIFKMDLINSFSWEETALFCSAVRMNNLKQLLVKCSIGHDTSLLPLTNLIRASPCLQRFVLEVSHWSFRYENIINMWTQTLWQPYHCLKLVEFVGYRGAVSEVELINNFVQNGVALKEIRVDPRLSQDEVSRWLSTRHLIPTTHFQDEISARTRAENQLMKMVTRNINLKII